MKDSENAKKKLQDIIKNVERVYSHLIPTTTVRINEKEFCKVKDQVVDSLQKHQQRTKEFKDLLKRLKNENTRLLAQIGEKDEEIDRLKDEVSQQEEVADDSHLESQLEEARRKEVVLRDQLVEKDKAYQMLEAEVVE